MNVTSLFFDNFFKIASLPFQTLGTTESSASLGGSSIFLTAGECLTNGVQELTGCDDGNCLFGSTSMASATATMATYMQVHDIDYPDVQLTKAYIESLNQEELTELIANLDALDNDTQEENILAKRI